MGQWYHEAIARTEMPVIGFVLFFDAGGLPRDGSGQAELFGITKGEYV